MLDDPIDGPAYDPDLEGPVLSLARAVVIQALLDASAPGQGELEKALDGYLFLLEAGLWLEASGLPFADPIAALRTDRAGVRKLLQNYQNFGPSMRKVTHTRKTRNKEAL